MDLEALRKQAFRPAVKDVKYMPIRADLQTGSVVIKDRLEQRVYADLMLVDVVSRRAAVANQLR